MIGRLLDESAIANGRQQRGEMSTALDPASNGPAETRPRSVAINAMTATTTNRA